jgi:hypothetical protein
MMETAQLLGNFGEFVGAIAVVATLMYLAFQIRQSTRASQHTAFHEAMRDQVAALHLLSTHAELSEIIYKGLADFESLPEDEKRRFETWINSWLRTAESLLYEVESSRIEPEEWLGVREHLKFAFSRPGFRQWWQHPRYNLFNQRLQDFINNDVLGTA